MYEAPHRNMWTAHNRPGRECRLSRRHSRLLVDRCRPALVLLAAAAIWLGVRQIAVVPTADGPERRQPAETSRAGLREPTVLLNGNPLGRASLEGRHGAREDALLRVADLAMAVDGPAPGARRHLDLRGASLYATALGGCESCPVRVKRAVLISSRLRLVNEEPYLPLRDLVRALEGKLEVDTATGVYGIHAGACTWCILEPNGG